MDLADNAPSAAEAMLRLYRSFVDRRGSSDLPEHERTSGRGSIPAAEWVQEYIQGHRNFFQDLDEAAEHLAKRLDGTAGDLRSEEHTSELKSLMRIPYAVFCLKKKRTPGTNAQKACPIH